MKRGCEYIKSMNWWIRCNSRLKHFSEKKREILCNSMRYELNGVRILGCVQVHLIMLVGLFVVW